MPEPKSIPHEFHLAMIREHVAKGGPTRADKRAKWRLMRDNWIPNFIGRKHLPLIEAYPK